MKKTLTILLAIIMLAACTGEEAKTFDFEQVDVKPEYEGGYAEFQRYIYRNVGNDKKASGKAVIEFVIGTNGGVTFARILKSDVPYNQKILDAIKNARGWSAGMKDGKKVKVRVIQPLIFKATIN